MSATIKIRGVEATCDMYRWRSNDKQLAAMLNRMLDPLGPSGSDPNPDLHAAKEAVELLGGKVVKFDKTEAEKGVVY